MSEASKRDPLAIAIASVGVFVQIAMWIWWGGRMSQRVDDIQRRIDTQEIQAGAFAATQSQQKSDIAVLNAKLDDIRAGVDAVNRKLDKR